MAIPKAMSIALSTAAFAGFTALAAGAATSANAQTMTGAAQQPANVQYCDQFGRCYWGWQQPVYSWQQPVAYWHRPWHHHHHHGLWQRPWRHHHGHWGR
jgi:hypothetical protein